MKYSLKAAGIIEAMVVLLLLTVGVTGVYSVLVSSQRLSQSTSYRIEAIQIARDGLEAMTNIRDTNWIEFGGDVRNCWNTWNYDSDCIGNNTAPFSPRISHDSNQSLRLYRDDSSGKFMLEKQPRLGENYANINYRNNFRVYYDDNGFYTQSGSLNLRREYTREIQVVYPETGVMDITVLVQWQDPAVATARRLEMSTRLTNWKDRD